MTPCKHSGRLLTERITLLLRLSSGGVAFTDLQQPTKTQRLAVRTMLTFTGIGMKAGSTAKTARRARALVAGFFTFASLPRTGCTTGCTISVRRTTSLRRSMMQVRHDDGDRQIGKVLRSTRRGGWQIS